MRDPRTLVRVQSISCGVVETDGNNWPVLGVLRVTTPGGDRLNLALTPAQVDATWDQLGAIGVEMMLR